MIWQPFYIDLGATLVDELIFAVLQIATSYSGLLFTKFGNCSDLLHRRDKILRSNMTSDFVIHLGARTNLLNVLTVTNKRVAIFCNPKPTRVDCRTSEFDGF